jgi:2-polyprenyl-3-methyl-5-hydroxy-6-metoxy-1,4-benzoquinol methylase
MITESSQREPWKTSQKELTNATMNQPCAAPANYYELHADEYSKSTVGLDMSSVYERFSAEIRPGAHIADAGCGSGRDTKMFLQKGYRVTAFDGSAQMARVASIYTGQNCNALRFQDIQFEQEFDAIWACASLLHVPKREMIDVLRRLLTALRANGVIYASFIEGEGEREAADFRLYNSYTQDSFTALLEGIGGGISRVTSWKSDENVVPTNRAPWLNFLIRTARS